MGKTAFWIAFVVILSMLILSIIFGSIWCGWLCWLGALHEFIFQKNRWKLLKTKKAQTILFYVQTVIFAILVLWIIGMQRPVLCAYDPFISVFRLKIFNWIGYITVPLLLLSSLLIYRPFCRIICPVGWLLYIVKFIPFARKLKITECSNCRKCLKYCKMDAIHDNKIEKTCTFCGECKKGGCDAFS
jgi:polyferredoxin